jgi:hypothetical protein
MSVSTLGRRIDQLRGGPGIGLAEQLWMARERLEERERAWHAAGNDGNPPPEPLAPLPSNAGRIARETWRRLAHGRARVAHDRCGETSPFRDFSDIYVHSDADLAPAINQAEKIAHQAELLAWEAEREA